MPKPTNAITLSDLPTYPWNYDGSYWAESRLMTDYRNRKHRKHELLGLRVLESSDIEPAWRNLLKLSDAPWLGDHCVEKDIVFPAAGYVAIAGAAVGQLTSSVAYTVQEVNIATAMLLNERETREIITSLRRRDWTTTNISRWWEFSITSESKGTWTKHCWGLVTDGCVSSEPLHEVKPYTRKVEPKRWYDTMARVGLNYGTTFTGLYDITASPIDQMASAKVVDISTDASAYALHPSTMDMILQSQAIALTRGQYRQFNALWLPTFIEQVYVSAEGTHKTLDICTYSSVVQGSAIASSHGMVDKQVAYMLKGLKGAKMANSGAQSETGQEYLSLEWHSSIDFVRSDTLIRPTADITSELAFLERFSLLCAAEIQLEAKNITSYAQPHFKHFMASIDSQLRDRRRHGHIPDAVELMGISREKRQEMITESRERSRGTQFENAVEMMWRIHSNIGDILEGRQSFLDIALVDGVLTGFYNESNSLSNVNDWFTVLGMSKPYIRILEASPLL
jgi:acyl transferase domain-containing protein